MKKQISDERKRKAAAYAALPIAKVLHPLKFLQKRCLSFNPYLVEATAAAKRGDGFSVQRNALNFIN